MKKNRTIWSAVYALCLYSILAFTACNAYEVPEKQTIPVGEGGSVIISMKIPGISNPTRAMSAQDEQKVSVVRCLVFKGQEFLYSPDLTASGPQTGDKVDYIVKLHPTTDNIRLVLLANHFDDAGKLILTEPAAGTGKDEFLKSLQFAAPTKWTDGTAFPMWGETSDITVDKEEGIKLVSGTLSNGKLPVSLLRAVARVDVGVNFKLEGELATEEAEGLDHFKLAGVSVFRAKKTGYVSPIEANLAAAKASVATDFVNYTDDEIGKDNLTYIIPEGKNAFCREIYIAETEVSAADDHKNRTCLIIGGYFIDGNAPKQTYYRIDFEKSETELHEILRNHRYVVDIRTVKGHGAPTIDDALAGTADGQLEALVHVWDQNVMSMHVNGKYFFGVDTKEVIVAHRQGAQSSVNFTTDLLGFNAGNDVKVIADPNGVHPNFEDLFDVQINDNNIAFTAKSENTEADPKKRSVMVEVSNGGQKVFEIPMVVIQNSNINFFDIECKNVKVIGILKEGESLSPERNKISVRLTLAHGASFSEEKTVNLKATTEHVTDMYFEGSGVFKTGVNTIEIELIGKGSGVILSREPIKFTIRDADGISTTTCDVMLRPALKVSKVLLLTNDLKDKSFLYAPSNKGATQRMIENKYNFGNDDESRVPLEAEKLAVTATDTPPGDFSSYDVVVVSGKFDLDARKNPIPASALNKFLESGGSLIYLQESLGRSSDARKARANWQFVATLAETSISDNVRASRGSLFQVTDEHSDMITNGIFGDVRGNWWGLDKGGSGSRTGGLMFGDKKNLIVYSTGITKNADKQAGGLAAATMFRLTNHSVFCVVESGFSTLPEGGHERSTTGYPAAADSDPLADNVGDGSTHLYVPVQKLGFGKRAGKKESGSAWNSVIFCNALSWALQQADIKKYPAPGAPVPPTPAPPTPTPPTPTPPVTP